MMSAGWAVLRHPVRIAALHSGGATGARGLPHTRPLRAIARLGGSALLIAAGAFAVQHVRVVPPSWSAADRARLALPADLPLPAGMRITDAAAGRNLPYQIIGHVGRPPAAVAASYAHLTSSRGWTLAGTNSRPGHVELLQLGTDGRPVYLGLIDILPEGDGSRVIVQFSPLPIALANG